MRQGIEDLLQSMLQTLSRFYANWILWLHKNEPPLLWYWYYPLDQASQQESSSISRWVKG